MLCLTLVVQLFKPQAKCTLTLSNATFVLVILGGGELLKMCVEKYRGFLDKVAWVYVFFFYMYSGTAEKKTSMYFWSSTKEFLGSTLEYHVNTMVHEF